MMKPVGSASVVYDLNPRIFCTGLKFKETQVRYKSQRFHSDMMDRAVTTFGNSLSVKLLQELDFYLTYPNDSNKNDPCFFHHLLF